jgi:hypothetical protein
VSIVRDMEDRRLLGAHPAYTNGLSSFSSWLVVHKAISGEQLDEQERAVFERIAGQPYEPRPWSTVAILSPRRCGKSLFASTVVAHSAYRPGPRNTWAVLVGADRAGAQKALLNTVTDFFSEENGGLLHQLVTNRTAETIELSSGCGIATWPTRPAAARGIAARVAIIDEADFTSEAGGEDKTRAMVAALRPALAGVPNSRLILISSPGRVGSFFHRLIADFWGRPDPHTLVLKLDTSANPNLTADYFDAMRTLDPVAYRAEVLGEYVEVDGGLFDLQAVARCTVSGRGDIPPEALSDRAVVCAVDAATGARNGDSFAACWGYREGDRVVVAAVRRWSPPFDPRAVVGEIATLSKRYGTRRAVGDRFGSNLIASLFRDAGMNYEPSTVSTSDALLELAPAFATGSVELPDPVASSVADDLRQDLAGVVRRAGGGKDRADLPRNSRGHCDTAASLGVLFAALPKAKPRPRLGRITSLRVGPRPSLFHGLQPTRPVRYYNDFEEAA